MLCLPLSTVCKPKHAKEGHQSPTNVQRTLQHSSTYLFRDDVSSNTVAQSIFQSFLEKLYWSCKTVVLISHNIEGKFSLGCNTLEAWCSAPSVKWNNRFSFRANTIFCGFSNNQLMEDMNKTGGKKTPHWHNRSIWLHVHSEKEFGQNMLSLEFLT